MTVYDAHENINSQELESTPEQQSSTGFDNSIIVKFSRGVSDVQSKREDLSQDKGSLLYGSKKRR